MNKFKAIWFSRHNPTEEQIANASNMGYEFVAIKKGKILASIDIESIELIEATMKSVMKLTKKHKAYAVFGEFPAIVQSYIAFVSSTRKRNPWPTEDILYCTSWNVQKSVGCGNLTFVHKRWCQVGWTMNYYYSLFNTRMS